MAVRTKHTNVETLPRVGQQMQLDTQ
jgi:hypothetical protein